MIGVEEPLIVMVSMSSLTTVLTTSQTDVGVH
jgi:hypothetical protein